MARWADLETRVRATVGSSTSAEARVWLLEAARMLNDEAEYLTVESAITTTVADQADYALATDLVDLAAVRVGTTVYTKASSNDIWALEDSNNPATLDGPGGLFAPAWSSTGAPKITLWPVPDETGLTIEGRQVITVPSPTWASDDPPFPAPYDKALWHGAVAAGLAEKDEQLDESAFHEERFWAFAARLKRRKNSRIGSGALRLRVPARDNARRGF